MILVLILSNRLLRSWRRCSPHSQPAQQTLPHKSGGTTGYSCHHTGPSLPVRKTQKKKAIVIHAGKRDTHTQKQNNYISNDALDYKTSSKHFNYARANLVSFWLLTSLCRAHGPILLRVIWIRWVRKGVGRGGGSFLLSSPFFVHFGLLFPGLLYLVSVLPFHVLLL